MKTLQQQWSTFLEKRFPDNAHDTEFNLEILSHEIEQAIQDYLNTSTLDAQTKINLEKDIASLEANLLVMPRNLQSYFDELLEIAREVLRRCR